MPALYKVSKNTQPLYITLNMASAVFAEKLDDFQDLIQLIHKSSHCTLNSSCKKPKDKNSCLVFEMCMEWIMDRVAAVLILVFCGFYFSFGVDACNLV